MPFRERAKTFFKGRNRDDSVSTTSSRKGSNHRVYKPGEEMPPPKYRRPPQKEHKDKLEAFSFGDAWRKRSFQSLHSPMGTRTSSRRASMRSMHKGAGLKSMTLANENLDPNDTASTEAAMSDASKKDSVSGVPALKLPTEPEREGDKSAANVALSHTNSKGTGSKSSRPRTAEAKQPNGHPNALHKTMSTAHDHQPFSEQDVANAMKRSKMAVAAQ